MATLTVGTIIRTGTGFESALVAAAGGGDEFANTGFEFFRITNGAITCNVTFTTPRTVAGMAITDLAVAVGAGTTRMIGPFPVGTYNNGNGLVQVTYDDVTNVTVEVLTF